jgi:hypothetical protein
VLNHSYLSGGVVGFNCNFPTAGVNSEIYDSTILNSVGNGIDGHCPNVKIQRNVISGVQGDGIHLANAQSIVEGNVIEQNVGNGLSCVNGNQIGIEDNWFDNNGKSTTMPYGQNLLINGCQAVSVAGNQFHRSNPGGEIGPLPAPSDTAHVLFEGLNDSIAMAGNSYYVGSDTANVAIRPDYDVEFATPAAPGSPPTVVTNFSFADAPTPQNKGVFGPNALAALGPLPTAAPENFLTGYVASNSGSSATLSIGGGSAMDSSNSMLINLPSGCSVNLGTNGAGGLDSGSVAPSTQYNFFAFGQGSYGSSPACIATLGTNPVTAPSFVKAFPPPNVCNGTPPAYAVALTANVTPNSNVLVSAASLNGSSGLNPLAGLAVGDAVADCVNNSYITTGSTISSLSSIYVSFMGTTTAHSPCVTSLSSIANLYVGEKIGNTAGGHAVGKETTIIAINSGTVCSGSTPPYLQMSQSAANPVTGATLAASTNATIILNNNTSATACSPNPACQERIYIYNDRYRMLAALYTNSSSGVEAFAQDGDTFYLAKPANDINASIGSSVPIAVALNSVPVGISVEAFGRCVGGGSTATHHIILYSPTLAPGTPTTFPTVPGFDVASLTANVAFPFRAYTNTSQTLDAFADAGAGSTTLQCMTDGWVWNRGK